MLRRTLSLAGFIKLSKGKAERVVEFGILATFIADSFGVIADYLAVNACGAASTVAAAVSSHNVVVWPERRRNHA